MKKSLTDLHIFFYEKPYCEHCGDLEPYDAVFCEEDGVCWCLDCSFDLKLSHEDRNKVIEAECKMKIIYYTNMIKSLEKK